MTNDEKRRILCGLIADGKNARIHTERAVLILESIGKFTFEGVDSSSRGGYILWPVVRGGWHCRPQRLGVICGY